MAHTAQGKDLNLEWKLAQYESELVKENISISNVFPTILRSNIWFIIVDEAKLILGMCYVLLE